MNTTYPIREYRDIKRLEDYFLGRSEYRNYLLIVFCLNTALRISDILKIKWQDVCSKGGKINSHIIISEGKTGKTAKVYINRQIRSAIALYLKNSKKSIYLFDNGMGEHISRVQAHRIIHSAGSVLGMGDLSCHSLRKTFGYHAWKSGVPPALLMEIYNHSSYNVTKRYLGIAQEDKDKVFNNVVL